MKFKTSLSARVFSDGQNNYIGVGTNQKLVSDFKFKKIIDLLFFLKQEKTETELDCFLEKENIEQTLFFELLHRRLITANEHLFTRKDEVNFKNELYLDLLFQNSKEITERIHEYTFVIVGCGGIGNFVSFALNTFTPKEIILVDGDKIERSNLNRQFIFDEYDIGKYKSDILKQRLNDKNSNSIISSYAEYGNVSNLEKIFSKQENSKTIIILSGDSYTALSSTTRVCVDLKIPFLNVGYLNDISCIGPFYIPGLSSCPFCHNTLVSKDTNSLAKEKVTQINKDNTAPSSFINNALASSMCILDILNYLSGDMKSMLSFNTRLGLSNKTLNKEKLKVEIDPNCSFCSKVS